MPGGEAQRVGDQQVALLRHTLQQVQIDAGDLRHRRQRRARWVPDEGVRTIQPGQSGRRRREAFQRLGYAGE